ncbi:MAG: hypothetical protein ACI9K3_000717 [Halovenus sp.]
MSDSERNTPPRRGDGESGRQDGAPSEEDGLNRRRLLLLGGATTVGVFALSRTELTSSNEMRNIELKLELNARTLEADEFTAHMDTFHPESPIYGEAETRASELIRDSNVTVSLSFEGITVEDTTAEADVVRTTRGDSHEAVREEITYELRRYEGEWQIYNRTVRESGPPSETNNG